jgi:nucleoporin SEH1
MTAAGEEWVCQSAFKAHSGPIWRISWAHPEFGNILASCSFDHNVHLWEEQEGVEASGQVVAGWRRRAQLGDARASVNDVKFAPRHLGLKLATGSADGAVRIYEAGDATSLAHWEFVEEFVADMPSDMVRAGSRGRGSDRGRDSDASGSDSDASSAGGAARPPPRRRSSGSGGSDSSDSASDYSSDGDAEQRNGPGGGVSCLAWTTSPFDVPMLLVGCCAPAAPLRIWGFASAARCWIPMLELHGHSQGVHDVAWAPNVGRSFHLIAAAGREGTVSLWRVQPEATADVAPPAASTAASPGGSLSRPAIEWLVRPQAGTIVGGSHVSSWSDHAPGAKVWRVDWNVVGTALASSGDDGMVYFRKQSASGLRWEAAGSVSLAQGSSTTAEAERENQHQHLHDKAAASAAPTKAAAESTLAFAGRKAGPGLQSKNSR